MKMKNLKLWPLITVVCIVAMIVHAIFFSDLNFKSDKSCIHFDCDSADTLLVLSQVAIVEELSEMPKGYREEFLRKQMRLFNDLKITYLKQMEFNEYLENLTKKIRR